MLDGNYEQGRYSDLAGVGETTPGERLQEGLSVLKWLALAVGAGFLAMSLLRLRR
jgi:hypothetical protein